LANHLGNIKSVGKTTLMVVCLGLAIVTQQIVDSSAEVNHPSAGRGLPTLPVARKEIAPQKEPLPDGHRHTTEIVTEGPQSTSLTIAYEMARALGSDQETGALHKMSPRVVPIVGSGGIQNIVDLLTLPGADMAIAPAALLNRVRDSGEFGDIRNKLVYIAPLFLEEFHVLAVSDIHSIRDLGGKTVNLGQRGSVGAVLGHEILERLGIKADELNIDFSAALDGMRSGRISATLLVSGKPVRSLTTSKELEGLHFIAVPYSPDQKHLYLPSALKHEDYPNLITAGDSIDTIGTTSILLAYNWPPGSEGFDLLTSFSQILVSRLPALRTEPNHPKWREVNLAATFAGWARFTPAGPSESQSTEPESRALVKRFSDHHQMPKLGAALLGWILFGTPERWNDRKRVEYESNTHTCVRHRCGPHHEWARKSH
jgi:uncharacterized protein